MPRKSAADFSISPTAVQRLRPPPDLVGPEREQFLSLVLSCPANHFTASDAPLLCAYARAVCLEQTASSELAAAGHVIDGRPSAWLEILKTATRSMTTLARLLRLTPLARREQAPSVEERQSYYQRAALEAASHEHEPDPN